MSDEKFLKITYHGGSPPKKTKLNAYLKMPSPTFAVLKREIAICIFDERQQPRSELRTYWIDEEGDEIGIVNQCDYEIFMSKLANRRHLQVAPINEDAGTTGKGQSTGDSNVDATSFVIHETVECDNCLNAPIVGFRYKCIQCPNYDLCERCEAQHMHAEHMMVRMPTANCPSAISAWISGNNGRRHHRQRGAAGRVGDGCPFVAAGTHSNATGQSAGDTSATAGCKSGGEGGKEHHHGRHGRKHHRRQMQNGIFTHLYNMMHDLAEGGGPVGDSESDVPTPRVPQSHTAVHEAAHEAATKAAEAAASAATAAAQVAFNIMPQEAPKEESTGAAPKMPQTQPNDANTKEPEVKKSNEPTLNDAANNAKASPTPTIPSSPSLEAFTQFVDPQYMKAGIQILNNFSEMFAKMIDPVNGSSDGSNKSFCPFQAAGFPQERKSSSASSTASASSNVSTSTISTSANEKAATEKITTEKPEESTLETDGPANAAATPEAAAATIEPKTVKETAVTSNADSTAQTPERRRLNSEEHDWQIIDQQSQTPRESTSTSTESFDGAAAVATPVPSPAASAQTQTPEINYAQLSLGLRAHVEQEQKRLASQAAAAAPATPPTTPVVDASTTAQQPPAPEEKRSVPIYHIDQRINSAVHAMMAMGFSNEGAWLTQLLESVDGSIPKALDMMSAAQRLN